MEQEDYLKRQIDQLARVLGKAFFDLVGLKNKGQAGLGMEMTDQTLKNELDLDIRELIDLKNDDFIEILTVKNKMGHENLGWLAEILLQIADCKPEDEKKKLYLKSLTIYEYLENADMTYSFDRRQKISHIRALL